MKKLAAICSIIILLITITYLGGRTLQHEVLTRQNQNQVLAQSYMNNIKTSIESLLNERASHLNAMAQFLPLDQNSIETLLQRESDIKNIFVIEKNKINYLTNANDTAWLQLVDSIAYDNSILFSNLTKSEQYQPQMGWFQSYDHIIFWRFQSDIIIGFELSKVKFSLDLINLLDNQSLSDNFELIDSGKVIYTNGTALQRHMQSTLNYPLQNWQLTYYYQSNDLTSLYLLGGSMIIFFVIIVISLCIYCYREYTRTLRLAQQQVSFVGQVSHEFKTPLTNITLYSEMLQEKLEDEPEPIPHYLHVISSESQRLTRLIQNVLNFNKTSKLTIKPVNLTQLIRQIYATFEPILASKSLQLNLVVDTEDDNIIINTDHDSVMQIINNFLSNAEKYSADGKQVDLSISRENMDVVITVRDYGKGIPTHLQKQIFKPFYRVHSALTEGVSGTGIGLTIASQLAAQLQGSIIVDNCDPGVAFALILPESK